MPDIKFISQTAKIFAVLLLFFGVAHGAEIYEVSVKTSSGMVIPFAVEVADSPAERSQGLMGRHDLGRDEGMVFIYGDEQILSFWMKDTPLSLDIIFFDAEGVYVSHHGETTPYSVKSLRSSFPARYVLEINGGLAEEWGIGEGSMLLLPGSLLGVSE